MCRQPGGDCDLRQPAADRGATAFTGSISIGTIDEVRIYNIALTPAQIQADMNTPIGSGGSGPPPPGSHADQFKLGLWKSGHGHGKRSEGRGLDEYRGFTAGDRKHIDLRPQ